MHTGLNSPGHYLHWGVVQISVANLIVIGLMVALFVLAIVVPFPKGEAIEIKGSDDDGDQ